jgi:hypothetical protein
LLGIPKDRVDATAASLPAEATEIVSNEKAEMLASLHSCYRPESDIEAAEFWAGVVTAQDPGEKEALLNFAYHRSRRLVMANADLIVALVPVLILKPG